jgi:four helix bundle protein
MESDGAQVSCCENHGEKINCRLKISDCRFSMAQATTPQILRDRTKRFALLVIRCCRAIPRNEESRIICRQLLRSATSVAANYRAVCRARSSADFISKMGIVLEEADESLFWLELLEESGIAPPEKLRPLLKESNELVSIFVASLRTVKGIGDHTAPNARQLNNVSI